MKFQITKEFKFEAAHHLPNHDGKCARLHGHSWKMRVVIAGDKLHTEGPERGMLMDFGRVSLVCKSLVDSFLDHYYLNETLAIKDPTSEAVAQWVYRQLKPTFPNLLAVEIDETCTSSCRYQEL